MRLKILIMALGAVVILGLTIISYIQLLPLPAKQERNLTGTEEILKKVRENLIRETFLASGEENLTVEYAPPDKMKISGLKKGFPPYIAIEGIFGGVYPHQNPSKIILIGSRTYSSDNGIGWVKSPKPFCLQIFRMLDPRKTIELSTGAVSDGEERIGIKNYTIIRIGLNVSNFVKAIEISESRETEIAAHYKNISIKFWVNEKEFLLRKMEISRIPIDVEFSLTFSDYGKDIKIQKPENLTGSSNAYRLNTKTATRIYILYQAILEYKQKYGTVPPNLTHEVLQEFIDKWPTNPIVGGPIKEEMNSPGNFHYVVLDRENFILTGYGWDAIPTGIFSSMGIRNISRLD